MIERIKKFVRSRRVEILKPFAKNLEPEEIRYTFCSLDKECTSAFVHNFHDVDNVEIILGSIFDAEADALVSPANSFGEMSGGLDKSIDGFYENRAQKTVMSRIQNHYYGELPVGTGEVFLMSSKRFPFLIVAPTMGIPGILPEGSYNAYLAMRAVLIAIREHNIKSEEKISSVAIPSFCTGVGGMHYQESGKQMRQGYEMIENNCYRNVKHPALASF